MIVYSQASNSDLEQLTDLFFASFSQLYKERYNFLPSKKLVKKIMLAEISAGNFFAARENGRIIGYVNGIKNFFHLWKASARTAPELFLPWNLYNICPINIFHMSKAYALNLAVHPDFQGKGISDALMKKLLASLKEQGIKEVYCQTHKTNYPAQALCKRTGWQHVSSHGWGKNKAEVLKVKIM